MWTLLLLACSADPAPDSHGETHAKHHDLHEGHGEHAEAHHRFDDPERWAKVFDDPERDSWQQPEAVIGAMQIRPGMVVADLGAGTGYLVPHLLRAVGTEGRVLALDVEPKLVTYMDQRAKREHWTNVGGFEARVVQPDDPGLAEASVDRVVLVDVYHHIGARAAYFAKVAKGLREGGELVVVDLTKDAPFGPPVEERLTAEQVETELKGTFELARRVDLPHQYVLVFAVR